jgi:hypothetical protein
MQRETRLTLLDNMLLQAQKGLLPFAVNHRHVDIKMPEKTIGSVFYSTGDSLRCPRHSLSDRAG